MKRKKRKILRTPEERADWELRGEAMQRMLQDHIDRIAAELRARGEEVRDVEWWMERIRAERAGELRPD